MTIDIPDQSGRLAVVTGANSGTGKETARGLASAGARVILAVRTRAKGDDARRDILADHPDADVQVRRLDLADLASIQQFADDLIAEGRPLDLLINNAGVMMLPQRHETADGFEMQFGTNFLGHFALTLRLLPLLLQADSPRVVTVSSGNQSPIDFADLNAERSYSPNRAYGQSKLADLLFSRQLARLADANDLNLLSVGAHPGAASTNIFANGAQYGGKPILILRLALLVTPRHSAAAGAAPMLYAATRPDVAQADYYGPRFGLVGSPTRAKVSAAGRDKEVAARLWAEAERLTGLTFAEQSSQQ